MKGFQSALDKTAISLSFLCVAHCLLLPIAVSLFPVLLALPFSDERFHLLLVFAVLPTSLIGLGMGCKKHRDWRVMGWGLFGVLIVLLAVLVGHDLAGEAGEKALTVFGSLFIVWGHIQNYRLCRSAVCHSPECGERV